MCSYLWLYLQFCYICFIPISERKQQVSNWKTIYETDNEYRVHIVNDILEDRGINSVILKKKDSSYNNFGRYELNVDSNDVIKAMKIISDEIDFE